MWLESIWCELSATQDTYYDHYIPYSVFRLITIIILYTPSANKTVIIIIIIIIMVVDI